MKSPFLFCALATLLVSGSAWAFDIEHPEFSLTIPGAPCALYPAERFDAEACAAYEIYEPPPAESIDPYGDSLVQAVVPFEQTDLWVIVSYGYDIGEYSLNATARQFLAGLEDELQAQFGDARVESPSGGRWDPIEADGAVGLHSGWTIDDSPAMPGGEYAETTMVLSYDGAVIVSVLGTDADRAAVGALLSQVRDSLSVTHPRTDASGRSYISNQRGAIRALIKLGFGLVAIVVGGFSVLRSRRLERQWGV